MWTRVGLYARLGSSSRLAALGEASLGRSGGVPGAGSLASGPGWAGRRALHVSAVQQVKNKAKKGSKSEADKSQQAKKKPKGPGNTPKGLAALPRISMDELLPSDEKAEQRIKELGADLLKEPPVSLAEALQRALLAKTNETGRNASLQDLDVFAVVRDYYLQARRQARAQAKQEPVDDRVLMPEEEERQLRATVEESMREQQRLEGLMQKQSRTQQQRRKSLGPEDAKWVMSNPYMADVYLRGMRNTDSFLPPGGSSSSRADVAAGDTPEFVPLEYNYNPVLIDNEWKDPEHPVEILHYDRPQPYEHPLQRLEIGDQRGWKKGQARTGVSRELQQFFQRNTPELAEYLKHETVAQQLLSKDRNPNTDPFFLKNPNLRRTQAREARKFNSPVMVKVGYLLDKADFQGAAKLFSETPHASRPSDAEWFWEAFQEAFAFRWRMESLQIVFSKTNNHYRTRERATESGPVTQQAPKLALKAGTATLQASSWTKPEQRVGDIVQYLTGRERVPDTNVSFAPMFLKYVLANHINSDLNAYTDVVARAARQTGERSRAYLREINGMLQHLPPNTAGCPDEALVNVLKNMCMTQQLVNWVKVYHEKGLLSRRFCALLMDAEFDRATQLVDIVVDHLAKLDSELPKFVDPRTEAVDPFMKFSYRLTRKQRLLAAGFGHHKCDELRDQIFEMAQHQIKILVVRAELSGEAPNDHQLCALADSAREVGLHRGMRLIKRILAESASRGQALPVYVLNAGLNICRFLEDEEKARFLSWVTQMQQHYAVGLDSDSEEQRLAYLASVVENHPDAHIRKEIVKDMLKFTRNFECAISRAKGHVEALRHLLHKCHLRFAEAAEETVNTGIPLADWATAFEVEKTEYGEKKYVAIGIILKAYLDCASLGELVEFLTRMNVRLSYFPPPDVFFDLIAAGSPEKQQILKRQMQKSTEHLYDYLPDPVRNKLAYL